MTLDSRALRHVTRVMRRHDLTNKKTMTKTNTKTKTVTKIMTKTMTKTIHLESTFKERT